MTPQVTESTQENFGPKESPEYLLRRQQDPFAALDTSPDNLGRLISMSADGLAASIKSGRTGEVIEFSTDLAYRLFANGDYRTAVSAAQQGANGVKSELDRDDITATEIMKLKMREIDLLTIQSISLYAAHSQSGDPETLKAADKVLEATTMQSIAMGVAGLSEAQLNYQKSDNSREKGYLSGSMFELLYSTWRRLQVYQDEAYDQLVVLGATDFEDRADKTSSSKGSHNFDVFVMGPTGKVKQLVQCKNSNDGVQYSKPIQKVVGRSFKEFIASPREYLKAVSVLASNSPEITEQQMQNAQELLDGLFEAKQTEKHVGAKAMVGATAS